MQINSGIYLKFTIKGAWFFLLAYHPFPPSTYYRSHQTMKTINCRIRFNLFLYAGLMAALFVAKPAYGGMGVDPATGLPIQTTNGLDVTFQKFVDSTEVQDLDAENTRVVSYKYNLQKMEAIVRLIKTVTNTNATKLDHGMAAFYLGELHAVEASDVLAQQITLNLGMETTALYQGLPMVCGLTSRDALIKIGTASNPAIIRNLAVSDDVKVRELSLQVLYRIEGDRDIVQLRLQKALAAEKDSTKQVRLQSALKDLAGTSFGN